MYDTWCLSVSPDILIIPNIPYIPNISDIPAIPEVPNISDIPNLHTHTKSGGPRSKIGRVIDICSEGEGEAAAGKTQFHSLDVRTNRKCHTFLEPQPRTDLCFSKWWKFNE